MRVLQLAKFYPPFRGGIESVVRHLTDGLRGAGVGVDVLCCSTDLQTQREHLDGGTVTRAGILARLLSTSISPALVRELHRCHGRYDVVHVHMPDPMAALALFVSSPAARIVVHWHSDVIRQRLSLRLYEPLQRWLLDRADAVIVTSKAYAESSLVLAPWRQKVRIVPIGIADMRARADDDEVRALRASWSARKVVLAVGRMTHYKGFDLLVEAARALPDDVTVVIAGAGDELAPLRQRVAALRLQERVLLPGALSDAQLMAHMGACDVFCLPSTSRAEAFGVAMLEAMSFGKPVVATRIAGSGVAWVNQAGRTGINVPVGCAASLGAALRRLTADGTLAARYGRGGRARYLQAFTAKRMTHDVVGLYREVLRRPVSAACSPVPVPAVHWSEAN